MLNDLSNVVQQSFNSGLELIGDISDFFPRIVFAIVTLLCFYFLARLSRTGLHGLLDRLNKLNSSLRKLLETLTFFAVMVLGLFAALGILELDKTVTSLLAGAGILGLAVSLAFQETIVNVIAGIGIAVREPILPGDLVRIGEFEGWVRGTHMRTTTIRSYHGHDVIIPNKLLYNDVVVNFDSSKQRRIDIGLAVAFGEDLEKVQSVLNEALQNIGMRDRDREIEVLFLDYGDSAIELVARFWLKDDNIGLWMEAKSEAIMRISSAFSQHDITIPYPIKTLEFNASAGKKLGIQQLQTAVRANSGLNHN